MTFKIRSLVVSVAIFIQVVHHTESMTIDQIIANAASTSTIIHEIGHAVGFHHEQTRPDRDRFVRILRENIPQNVFYNFQKYSQAVINTFDVPYDYSSVMHYGSTAFSNNGRLTIQTLDPQFQNVIGNRQGHSFLDIKLANLMYNCAERNNCGRKTCPREGFLGKDCNCWCPGTPAKLCDGGEIGEGGQTAGTSAPITESPDGCTDMNANCERWANIGECSNNPGYMTVFCMKSCGTCNPVLTCKDMNDNCDYWQGQGYCNRMYVRYMQTNCPRACGVCRSDEAEGGASTIVPTFSLFLAIFTSVITILN